MSSPRVPPRCVPTLTEVVQMPQAAPAPVREEAQAAHAMQAGMPQQTAAELLGSLEEQILHRVLQRIDLSLERQLNEAVAKVILDHTRELLPRLREEVEFVVRQAVTEAVAEELSARTPSA